jgi:hypothetical protein
MRKIKDGTFSVVCDGTKVGFSVVWGWGQGRIGFSGFATEVSLVEAIAL